MPLHHRVIDLLDLALLEGALQSDVRGLGLGDDHEAARADVQAVHDPLAFGGAGRRDGVPARREGAQDRGALPADARMRGDARRFVDHDDVVVVVDDAEIGHRHGDHPGLLALFPHDLEPRAAGKTIGLADDAAVHADSAGLGDLSRERAREPEHLGQGRVDPCPLEAVGHGKAPRRHD